MSIARIAKTFQIFSLICIAIVFGGRASAQTIVASEDFDGGDVNLTSGFDTSLNFQDPTQGFRLFGEFNFNSSSFAPFSLTDDTVADVSGSGVFEFDFEGIFGENKAGDDTFFAVCSYDEFFLSDESARTGSWTFDVSSADGDMELCIDMGQLSEDRFDGVNNNNTVLFEYRFDNSGPYLPAFSMAATELVGTNFQYRSMDNGNTPTIDIFGDDEKNNATAGTHRGFAAFGTGVTKTLADTGAVAADTICNKTVAATGEMDTFTAPLNGTGNTLELRMIADFSFEAFAFDNIVIKTEGGKFLLGDVNCDGEINLLDIAPFVALISSGGFSDKADINGDDVIDLLDVSPFVALLTGN